MESANNNKKIYGEQMKLSLVGFFSELPNLVCVTVAAIATGSMLTWLDFIDSLGNSVNAGFIVLISRKLKKDLRYEYNYGIGKIEALSTLCCDILMICGLLVIMVVSLQKIISPQQQSTLLFYVVFLKIVNVIFDSVYFTKQSRIKKTSGSSLVESKYADSLRALLFDAAILLFVLISYLFREDIFSQYFSPIASICISAWFFADAIKRCISSVNTLLDKTLSEDMQLKILKVLNRYYHSYEQLLSVNSRKNGNQICIELHLSFKPETSYAEIMAFLDAWRREIQEEIPDAIVTLVHQED